MSRGSKIPESLDRESIFGPGGPGGAAPKAWFNVKKQLIADLVLPVRLPALLIGCYTLYCTRLYFLANEAFDKNARFGTVRGRLLDIEKNNYFYNTVPRYKVHYEYVVDGTRYVSRRATTGSHYRDWMQGWLMMDDTITEAQYLQAFPVLRIGEPCTVFYDKKYPKSHSALAADANSAESGVALFLFAFPFIFANMFRWQYLELHKKVFPPKRRVKLPPWALQKPMKGGAPAGAGAGGAAAAPIDGTLPPPPSSSK